MNLLIRLLHLGNKRSKGSTAEPCVISPMQDGIILRTPTEKKPVSVSPAMLKQLFPVRNLSEEELEAFSLGREAEVYGPESILFRRKQPINALFYLLKGTVRMEVEEGSSYTIGANTPKARFPLCSGKVCSATAYAQTDIQVLRVSSKIMSSNINDRTAVLEFIDPHHPDVPERLQENKLFQAFCQYYRDEALELPSLPDVAIKLRSALVHEINIAEAAKIIQLDPIIAAKLVHVANCPLYLPAHPVNSCCDAITRLGLMATQNLVTTLSLKQVFNGKHPYVALKLREVWKRSIYLSALCFALASQNRGVNAEEALLAGLIADIGIVPFLYFAAKFPEEHQELEAIDWALPCFKGPVGAWVLKKWDFPPELVEIPVLAENWFYDSGDRLTLSDIVILASLHAHIGTSRMAELPAIHSLPACGKLTDGRLSPAHSLQVLHDAKAKINEALRFFTV